MLDDYETSKDLHFANAGTNFFRVIDTKLGIQFCIHISPIQNCYRPMVMSSGIQDFLDTERRNYCLKRFDTDSYGALVIHSEYRQAGCQSMQNFIEIDT